MRNMRDGVCNPVAYVLCSPQSHEARRGLQPRCLCFVQPTKTEARHETLRTGLQIPSSKNEPQHSMGVAGFTSQEPGRSRRTRYPVGYAVRTIGCRENRPCRCVLRPGWIRRAHPIPGAKRYAQRTIGCFDFAKNNNCCA